MPIVAVDDYNGSIANLRMFEQRLLNLRENFALYRLAGSVGFVYLLRQAVCGLRIVAQKQLERAVCGAHSARRIYSRRDGKRHGCSVDILIPSSGDVEQLVYAGARAVVYAAKSRLDYRAVFASKLDYVAYCAYCGKIGKILDNGGIVLKLHGARELKRNTRSAKLLKRA